MGIPLGKVQGGLPPVAAVGVRRQTGIKGEACLLVSPQGLRLQVQLAGEPEIEPYMIMAGRGEGWGRKLRRRWMPAT